MNSINKTISILKQNKHKLTKSRIEILMLFSKSTKPLSVLEIIESLHSNNLKVNKTTVYREIKFLESLSLIKSVNLSTSAIYYELSNLKHHHHLICNKCGKIDEVCCVDIEDSISNLESLIGEQGFKIQAHSLEFFGLCHTCLT